MRNAVAGAWVGTTGIGALVVEGGLTGTRAIKFLSIGRGTGGSGRTWVGVAGKGLTGVA